MGVSVQFGAALKNQVFFLEWSDGPGPNSRKRGTGFFISPKIALTAYHNTVREDPDGTIEGQYGDSKIIFTRVLAEPEYELAVLEVVKATPPLPDLAFERCVSVPLSEADTSIAWAGHAVSVVGYPREANFAKRSILGHISHDAICNTKRATNGEFRDWVPAALAIRPDRDGALAGLDGMSGAPLYDFEHQAVVGVVFGIQTRMYATQFAHLVERWTEAKRYITETAAPPTLRFAAPSWSSGTIADSPHPDRKTWRTIPALALVALVIAGGVYGFLGTPKAAGDLKSSIFTQLTDQPGAEASPSFSPDGLSFVYPSQMSGNWNIYLQRVSGKNPIPLTKGPADDLHPAFAPNGEQIAFRSERDGGGIFVMGATGEFVRRLTDFGYNPAWSPNAKQIVFCTEAANHPVLRGGAFKSQLWVVNTVTAEKRQLTKPEVVADAVQPSWSPSGARIAYWAIKGSQRDLWTVTANGTDPVPVTADSAVDSNPVWSPDGRHLYFVSDRGGSMNLWRVRIDEASGKTLGSPPEAITTPSPFVGSISISHDGKKIVYASRFLNSNIHTASFDPANEMIVGQIRPITRGPRQALYPDISPDDDRLVFHDLGKNQDVFIVNVDGTGLQQLTNDAYGDRHARWSPDGKRIAFRSNHDGKMDIWLVKPDGSSLQQLTYTPAAAISAPVWSPDGGHLVYSIPGANPFVIEAAKSWKAQSPKPLSVSNERTAAFQPWSWSPDGTKLVGQILRADSTNTGIGVYSLKSGKLDRLTDFGGSPRWMQDNRRLLFQDAAKLYVIDSSSGKTHEILSIAPHSFSGGIALSRDNRSIYFDITETEADIWLATLQ